MNRRDLFKRLIGAVVAVKAAPLPSAWIDSHELANFTNRFIIDVDGDVVDVVAWSRSSSSDAGPCLSDAPSL